MTRELLINNHPGFSAEEVLDELFVIVEAALEDGETGSMIRHLLKKDASERRAIVSGMVNKMKEAGEDSVLVRAVAFLCDDVVAAKVKEIVEYGRGDT